MNANFCESCAGSIETCDCSRPRPISVNYGGTLQFDPSNGQWGRAIPEPFHYGLIPWVLKRLTGWRDAYGRKAHVMWPWET